MHWATSLLPLDCPPVSTWRPCRRHWTEFLSTHSLGKVGNFHALLPLPWQTSMAYHTPRAKKPSVLSLPHLQGYGCWEACCWEACFPPSWSVHWNQIFQILANVLSADESSCVWTPLSQCRDPILLLCRLVCLFSGPDPTAYSTLTSFQLEYVLIAVRFPCRSSRTPLGCSALHCVALLGSSNWCFACWLAGWVVALPAHCSMVAGCWLNCRPADP